MKKKLKQDQKEFLDLKKSLKDHSNTFKICIFYFEKEINFKKFDRFSQLPKMFR